jgi:hypothetical protein
MNILVRSAARVQVRILVFLSEKNNIKVLLLGCSHFTQTLNRALRLFYHVDNLLVLYVLSNGARPNTTPTTVAVKFNPAATLLYNPIYCILMYG